MRRVNEKLFPGALEAEKRFPSHDLVVRENHHQAVCRSAQGRVSEGSGKGKEE